jgi:hypothetical protein
VTPIERQLPKSAVKSGLNEEETKRVATGLGYLENKYGLARFDRHNAYGGLTVERVQLYAPRGTLKVSTYLGDWVFSYGPRNRFIERPISQMKISWGIARWVGTEVDVDVRALLRDVNSDDAWWADIEIIMTCWG